MKPYREYAYYSINMHDSAELRALLRETILRERPEASHAMLIVLTRRVRELSRAAAPAR